MLCVLPPLPSALASCFTPLQPPVVYAGLCLSVRQVITNPLIWEGARHAANLQLVSMMLH